MACVSPGPGAYVCGVPNPTTLRKRYLRCPVCECTTEAVVSYDGWFGIRVMCCRCGDVWGDGELYTRPFVRGWRAEAVREHRRLWALATHGPDPSLREQGVEIDDIDVTGGGS